jgi:hypothetical protein
VHQHASEPGLLASILVQLAGEYAQLGDRAVRTTLLARAESLATAAGDRGALLEARCAEVDNLRTQGRYAEAEHVLLGADSLLHQGRQDPRIEAICLQEFTELENEAGLSHRYGVPAMRHAIALVDALGDTHDLIYIDMLSTLAGALMNDGDIRAALVAESHAMAMMDSTGRGETMDRAILMHNHAATLSNLGRTADAERLLHDVLERIERVDPAGRIPQQALIHYAHAALFQGDADSAAKYVALLDREGVQTHDLYWQGRALFGLAEAQLQLGRVADARRTVARFRTMSANPHLQHSADQVTDVRMLDALLAFAAGDTASAHAHVVDLLRASGYFDGKRRNRFHMALMLAAETALGLGKPEEALGYARAARETATLDSLTETQSAWVGEARLFEARALLASGDSAGARRASALALEGLRSGAGIEHPRTREAARLLATLAR